MEVPNCNVIITNIWISYHNQSKSPMMKAEFYN